MSWYVIIYCCIFEHEPTNMVVCGPSMFILSFVLGNTLLLIFWGIPFSLSRTRLNKNKNENKITKKPKKKETKPKTKNNILTKASNSNILRKSFPYFQNMSWYFTIYCCIFGHAPSYMVLCGPDMYNFCSLF